MRKEKTALNAGSINILQLITFIVGIVLTFVTILFWPIALLIFIVTIALIFIEGSMVNYRYNCPSCGRVVGKETVECIECGSELR